MRKLFLVSLVILAGALLFTAGCLDTDSTKVEQTPGATATPAPTAFTEQPTEASLLVPGPTQQAPSRNQVDVQVDKDIVYGDVTATFRGGLGQNFVSDITVDFYNANGGHESKKLDFSKIGNNVEFKGNKDKRDRVKVTVVYAGSIGTYVIFDELIPEKLPQQLS
ncbi:hypothetical protein L1994_04235 [Methanomicrobium antiquum]|uniref:Lipoprotein n=1 Tax=Methanomicrobium antiquum TaxID=487686 RepID=A0AAF0FQ46_9EURY|nr:hypothetical protein [Methanomicrobium antiquum]MDD3977151.1 hypothetical protein [Methanomicrobium sp.]WFN37605.1 hypothetical protein L1994_04235 [Methanomicrobium antiquum]